MATVWKGSTEIQEEPGSPHEVITAEGRRMTRRYRGPYATLQSVRPLVGTTIEGMDVVHIEIVREQGGSGRMTVELLDETEPEPIYEVEWTLLEKPLMTAPYFAPGGAAALDDEDLDKIEEWRSAATAADRTSQYEALSANAKLCADKLRAGIEAYVQAAPLARRTRRTSSRPSSSRCGQRETPPGFPGLPSGYVWLKTADRAMRQGRWGLWERVEEWTGADNWDEELY